MQVRLEKNAVKIVKAFGERQKIKTLSKAQLVNALIEEYDRIAQIEEELAMQPTTPPTDK